MRGMQCGVVLLMRLPLPSLALSPQFPQWPQVERVSWCWPGLGRIACQTEATHPLFLYKKPWDRLWRSFLFINFFIFILVLCFHSIPRRSLERTSIGVESVYKGKNYLQLKVVQIFRVSTIHLRLDSAHFFQLVTTIVLLASFCSPYNINKRHIDYCQSEELASFLALRTFLRKYC